MLVCYGRLVAAITIAGTAGTETQHTARTVARAHTAQQWQPLPPPLVPLQLLTCTCKVEPRRRLLRPSFAFFSIDVPPGFDTIIYGAVPTNCSFLPSVGSRLAWFLFTSLTVVPRLALVPLFQTCYSLFATKVPRKIIGFKRDMMASVCRTTVSYWLLRNQSKLFFA